jgi:hypothetical protein
MEKYKKKERQNDRKKLITERNIGTGNKTERKKERETESVSKIVGEKDQRLSCQSQSF